MKTRFHVIGLPAQAGHMLQAARKAAGVSQAQVGLQLGLSQSRISHLEKHADQLTLVQFLSWAALLGLQVQLGRPDAKSVQPTVSDW